MTKLFKKIAAIALGVVSIVTFTACNTAANAQQSYLKYIKNEDGVSYSVGFYPEGAGSSMDEATLQLSGIDPFDFDVLQGDLVIPSKYQMFSITELRDYAFYGCRALTSVKIPNSVKKIGESAFSMCFNLTSMEIPDKVTSIGDEAFYNCMKLASVKIGNSVTSIGEYAFYNCDGLTSVVIPDGVTSIREAAFLNCESLTSVEIGSSVTSIGERTFSECVKLKSVKIPNSVTEIEESAFSDCCGLTSIEIGDGVTNIGDYAFYGCDSLTSILIGNGVTSIGESAFSSLRAIADYDNYAWPNVYYKGSAEEWAQVLLGGNVLLEKEENFYYYSEAEPIEEGNFWHYVDGVPTVWVYEIPVNELEYTLSSDSTYYSVTGLGTCTETDGELDDGFLTPDEWEE